MHRHHHPTGAGADLASCPSAIPEVHRQGTPPARLPELGWLQGAVRRWARALLPVVWACCAVAGWGVGAPALAQSAAASTPDAIGASTQQWVNDMLSHSASTTEAMPLRMEVEVGALDSRLTLAPCTKVEPYLPTGARLWGRTRLGLRCVQGEKPWNVFLPLTVKAFGPAWVLSRPIAPGTVLADGDAIETEVDWAADAAPVVALAHHWVGQTAARYMPAGQTIRANMVRPPELFRAGAPVRVTAQGPGYEVTSGGQALMAGAVGTTVRVRMSSGKVITGVVAEDGSVKVPL